MIRIVTDQAIAARLARHREALACEFAAGIAALLPPPCDHNDRKSCPACSARRAVRAAVAKVRETGGGSL